ncbi:MAG TPA: hypothetical protein DCW90_24030 [Lachnospiraceae bacterium]|nr:hypothetical protein [Lachnospiraceae bacterium]
MNQKEYQRKIQLEKHKNQQAKMRQNIRDVRNKRRKPLKLNLSYSKLVLLGMIIMCFQIVFFCEYAIVTLADASAMYALIGIPVALAPIIWGYYSKSKAENTSGGIVYDMAMRNTEEISEDTDDSDGCVG